MTEKNIQTQIMIAASKTGTTVFRNNVGNGVLGQIVRQDGGNFHIIKGRRVQFGLCPGSSDLIGWRTVTVTPDMVNRKIAVFLALEVKTATGKATAEQENFINAVRASGGLAGIVRSIDDAVRVCNPLF